MAKTLFIILLATLSVSAQPELNQTFKRSVTVQIISNGKVTRQLTRESRFIFKDDGSTHETEIKQHGKNKDFKLTEADWKAVDSKAVFYRLEKLPREGLLSVGIVYHSHNDFGSRVTIKEIGELPPAETRIEKGAPVVYLPTWKPGSVIGVVVSGFTPEEVTTIKATLDSWNAVGLVRFEIRESGELKIVRKNVLKEMKMDSYFHGVADADSYLLSEGEIAIDGKTSDPDALQSHVAHEIGHSFGLSDCRDCKSIMRRPYKGMNKTNGYLAPTDVDIAALGLKVGGKKE